ncbi:MAG: HD domain-containing protein [Parvibaculaceae bacterium]
MDTVKFSQMKDGDAQDYALLAQLEKPFLAMTADRVLKELAHQAEDTLAGYKISRLDHGLQTATRAEREGADIDWVAAALLHDIGDGLAPQNHDRLAAELLRPYMREEVIWVVEHHASFQMYYYAHHYGWNRHEREKYRSSPYYQSCADFCERWDQSSFDPDYPTETLKHFEPVVREIFSRKAYDPKIMQPGVVKGLPPAPAQAAAE